MSPPPARRTDPLTIDVIVDAACAIVDDDGLAGLSMRRLGAALDVDPMAVYHHVGSKRELLAAMTARRVAAIPAIDEAEPWERRVRAWALGYWDVVVANRDLVAAGLADPAVAEGGVPYTRTLTDAVAASGVSADRVEPNVYLVVDFVHGAALAASAPRRRGPDELGPLRTAFERGLDTVVAGIATIAASQ